MNDSLPLFAHAPGILPHGAATHEAEPLRMQLFGHFRVFVGARLLDDAAWYSRKASSLVKMLALAPSHRLHREQIMGALWPGMGMESASTNLRKALYVARHILEPDLGRKDASSYLHLQREFVALIRPGSSWIDVAAFQEAATTASLAQDPRLYEAALSLYTGDLLPQDRNEDWVLRPRQQLLGLRLTLLLELGALQEQRGEIAAAIETLQLVVAIEPVHEEAHAKLMRLLAQAGHRNLALRQFGYLVGALRRELGAGPDPSTRALYHQILRGAVTPDLPAGAERPTRPPLVGHGRERRLLQDWLDRLCAGRGGLLFVRGEAGAGKSRLCAEIIAGAAQRGVILLTGEIPGQDASVAYRPIAMALEGYARGVAAGGPGAQLADMSSRLAGLWTACLALLDRDRPASSPAALDREHILPAITDFFTSLCTTAPVLVVLDDLHLAGEASVDLLQYLAGVAKDLRLLLVAAYRPGEATSALSSLVFKLIHGGLAGQLDVPRLDVEATTLLVTTLLGGPADHTLIERIYALAGGNPYLTEEAVQALRGRGQIASTGDRWQLQAEAAALPTSLNLRRRGNP